jgi:dipeptidyl-peptidase 4
MRLLFFTIVSLLSCSFLQAQKKQLDNEQYFKSNFATANIIQPTPMFDKWLNDNEFIYSQKGESFIYNCKKNTSTAYKLLEVNKGSVEVKPLIVTKSNNLFQRKNMEDVQLTFDNAKEVNPVLSPDGNYVAYTKNNNLYTVDINTKKETQLTNDGSDVILNGYLSWVYMEEIIGRASNYKGFWWSPDSKTIAYFRSDDTKVPVFTITDADGQHGLVETQRYPKSGDANPEVKIGFVSPQGGNTTWADFNAADDQYFGQPNWTLDSKSLFVNWMNRGNDKLIIYNVNPSTGTKLPIYEEQQKSWIDLDDNDRITFLKDGKGFLMLSDRTGWKHIYHYDMNGKLINSVTSGNYTVIGIQEIDEKKQELVFIARGKENSARRDLYTVKLNGKNLKRLTAGDYMHNATASPNKTFTATLFQNVNTPPTLGVVNVKKGTITNVATSKGNAFDEFEIAKTELIRVKSDDGKYDLPLKITYPLNYDASKKYPVLISIYGGPDAGTVWDTWSLNGTQQFMAKEGLIQVAMDHRASGHFGKEGVALMHRNLGYWEMEDYRTMTKWLIANKNVDATKVCITGFSYGGYISCYAVTHSSDLFTHAMAGGAVTDWLLYDSHYTEKLMDTPKENPEGYKSASVLTYADKYKSGLQLVHGAIDDNVHQQNSIQLLSKLQNLKKDVEFMTYSGGRHGWGGAKGAHFTNLKNKFIYQYLLTKPMPEALLK